MSWDTSTVPGHPAATVALSAVWLIIPHALIGLGEVLASIGWLEFFYEQAPDSMRSLGAAFLAATSGLVSIMRGSLAKPLTSSNYVETGSTIE
ncbi:unnamed protein product [Sphagnum troendelagicum]